MFVLRWSRLPENGYFMKLQLKLLGFVLMTGLLTAVILVSFHSQTPFVYAADCSNNSIGVTPLNDLGSGTYKGVQGGLYPGGNNGRPAAHEAAGMALSQSIQPLNKQGNPDANGVIVVAAIGMSNLYQEFGAFIDIAQNDPDKNPQVIFNNMGNPGVTSQRMADPDDVYWTSRVPKSLEKGDLSLEQVQVIWLKNSRGYPTEPFPEFAQLLQQDFIDIIHIAHDTFPNLKMVYLSSRIYAGYATSDLNPEPYAFQSGFSVKWLIESQINGDPALNFDPAQGAVKAPWLSWGPYMWADGTTPRTDGLTWACGDFESDGVHPSASGEEKVAISLLNYFKTNSITKNWFGEGNPLPISGFNNKFYLPAIQTE